jgi:hypothetical protein
MRHVPGNLKRTLLALAVIAALATGLATRTRDAHAAPKGDFCGWWCDLR